MRSMTGRDVVRINPRLGLAPATVSLGAVAVIASVSTLAAGILISPGDRSARQRAVVTAIPAVAEVVTRIPPDGGEARRVRVVYPGPITGR